MDPLTNPAFTLFAALSPMIIAVVKQQGFSRSANAIVACVCYLLVGGAGALLAGIPLIPENLPALWVAAGVIGTAAYHLVWTNLGVTPTQPLSVERRLQNVTSLQRFALAA